MNRWRGSCYACEPCLRYEAGVLRLSRSAMYTPRRRCFSLLAKSLEGSEKELFRMHHQVPKYLLKCSSLMLCVPGTCRHQTRHGPTIKVDRGAPTRLRVPKVNEEKLPRQSEHCEQLSYPDQLRRVSQQSHLLTKSVAAKKAACLFIEPKHTNGD